MTHPLTNEAFADLGAPILVYIRPIRAADAMADLPFATAEQAGLDPDQTLYALHGANGARLALMTDRDAAYAAALAHELAPVSLH
jgi:hypothetical protein